MGVGAFAFFGLAAFAGFFAILGSALGFAAVFFAVFAAFAMILGNGPELRRESSKGLQ